MKAKAKKNQKNLKKPVMKKMKSLIGKNLKKYK